MRPSHDSDTDDDSDDDDDGGDGGHHENAANDIPIFSPACAESTKVDNGSGVVIAFQTQFCLSLSRLLMLGCIEAPVDQQYCHVICLSTKTNYLI